MKKNLNLIVTSVLLALAILTPQKTLGCDHTIRKINDSALNVLHIQTNTIKTIREECVRVLEACGYTGTVFNEETKTGFLRVYQPEQQEALSNIFNLVIRYDNEMKIYQYKGIKQVQLGTLLPNPNATPDPTTIAFYDLYTQVVSALGILSQEIRNNGCMHRQHQNH